MAETRPNAEARSPGFKGPGPAELLVRCLAGRGPGTGDLGPATTDWNEVVDAAVREHVAPLLFKRLKDNDVRNLVPFDAWERLRRAFFTSGDRNARLFRELGAVLLRLRDSGIRVIVLKGAYLAEAVYGDVALRPMVDCDLLVRQTDLAGAETALLAMGAVHPTGRNRTTPARPARASHVEPVRGETKHDLPLFIHDLAVELHWTTVTPTGPVEVDAAGLWNRARPANVAGVEVLALSPEDLLLHLCLHFCYQHRLTGLRFLCDIAETIHRFCGELDWTQVAGRAREWGATRHVGLALRLARTMLGAEVPDDVLARLVPEGIDQSILEAATESVITRTLFHEMMPLPDMFGVRSIGGLEKLFWRRVFLSPEEMAAKYPASQGSKRFYLYYALRLRDGLRAIGSLARRRARLVPRSRARQRYAELNDWLKRQ
jgi:hypothetical protein